jgi:hypothetical protein
VSAYVYNGSVWERAKQLSLYNGTAWEEVGEAWWWNAGAWERLYVKPKFITDSFPTNGTLGAPWNSYSDNATYMPEVASGAWRLSNNSTDGTNYGYSIHSTQLAGDNALVQATITTTNNTWPSWLSLASDSNGQNRVNLRWTNTTIDLLRVISGVDQSVLATVGSQTQTAGNTFALTRLGNVFTAYVNGTQVLTYTDSSAVIPKGSGHRYVGLGGTRRRAAFVSSWSPNLDNFIANDL